MSEPPIIGSGSGHSVQLDGSGGLARSRQARATGEGAAAIATTAVPGGGPGDERPSDPPSVHAEPTITATEPVVVDGRSPGMQAETHPREEDFAFSDAIQERMVRLRAANAATRALIQPLTAGPAEGASRDGPAARGMRKTDIRQEPSDG